MVMVGRGARGDNSLLIKEKNPGKGHISGWVGNGQVMGLPKEVPWTRDLKGGKPAGEGGRGQCIL